MGYGGFFNLRKNIAMALDKELGEVYATLATCHTQEDFNTHDLEDEKIINSKHLDRDYADVLDFIYASDSDGKISYKTCKKIRDLLDNIDLTGKCFRYVAYSHNDYEDFKLFLSECYSKRRNMYWY
jgi:hypothetical protein